MKSPTITCDGCGTTEDVWSTPCVLVFEAKVARKDTGRNFYWDFCCKCGANLIKLIDQFVELQNTVTGYNEPTD